MGYRSNVEAVFYTRKQEDWPLLKLYVEENFPMDELGAALSEFHSSYHGFHFVVEDYKWYPAYSEVEAFDEFVAGFLRQAEESGGPPWAYEFARVGEDYSDTEYTAGGRPGYLLEVQRCIARSF